jgi:cytochrome P450
MTTSLAEHLPWHAAPAPRVPGPQGVPFLGVLPQFAKNPLAFLTRTSRTYGDIVSMGWRQNYMLTHPDAIERVLLTDGDHFIKDEVTRALSNGLGDGLLTSHGEAWKRSRKIVAPALKRSRISSYAQSMVTATDAYVKTIQTGEQRDIHRDMMHLTLDIVAATLFGADVASDAETIGHSLEALMEEFILSARTWRRLVPEWIPTPSKLRARKHVSGIDETLYAIIAKRREEGLGEDLLSLLLAATTEDGEKLNDEQLRNEALTLFVAGHETTALALGYAIYLISRHPEVEAALHAELDEVLSGRLPTADDTRSLPWTTAIVNETMRLYPPAWAIGRETIKPWTYNGHEFPVGSQFIMPQWVVHRDPRFWDNPGVFQPQRFIDGGPSHRFAFFPFGGGGRICVGNHFAMMEMVLVLATLYQRVRFESDGELQLQPSVTLRPIGGIHTTSWRRESAG